MMTVLSVAFPFAIVSPATAGGAEQVLLQMDAALTERGYRSIVIAPAGSAVRGELIAIPLVAPDRQKDAHQTIRASVRDVLEKESVDVIHMHGLDFADYLPDTFTPLLATLHLPPEWYPPAVFGDARCVLHCVSESQQQRCPDASNLLPYIPNGVDPEFYHPARRKRNYALALGRICPEKGLHHAIDAARIAGLPLILAGELFQYATHVQYFQQEIKPRKPKFVGPAGPERKRRLLAGARCVLVPSLAPETSSLTAMEAQACGTPVVAFPSGALPTIVRNGETGFVVQDTASMAEAIVKSGEIDPRSCRDNAINNFDVRKTAAAYIDTYQRLANEWAELFSQSPDAPPFLHPAWQRSWWKVFGNGEPVTFRVRRRGALAAIAVFYRYNERLVFAGNGISDRLGILSADEDAARELMDQLQDHRLDLQEIPEGSPLLELPHEPCSVCPVVDLTLAVAPRLSRQCAQQRRHLGAHRLFTTSDPALLENLFELHSKRWRTRGEPGVLATSEVAAFHTEAAPRLADAGLLRMHVLEASGRVIGVLYGLTTNRTMHYYLSGFDPYYAEFSPGSLLIEYAMNFARENGQQWFDFLRGAESYKYRWGAVDRIHYRILS